MSDSVVTGEVDRISTSGNGMLRSDHTEYNLGPVEHSLVGETVAAIPISPTWAFCLSPGRKATEYTQEFLAAASLEEAELWKIVDRKISTTASSDNRDFKSIFGAPTSVESSADFETVLENPSLEDIQSGEETELTVLFSTVKSAFASLSSGELVRIENPLLVAGESYRVSVTNREGVLTTAEVIEEEFSRVASQGDVFDVEVLAHRGGDPLGQIEGLPVRMVNLSASVGDTVKIAVGEVGPQAFLTSVEALPESVRPSVGTTISTEISLPSEGNATVYTDQGVPIVIPGGDYNFTGEAEIQITDVNRNSLAGEVDFRQFKTPDFQLGEEIPLTDFHQSDEEIIGYYNDVPVGLEWDGTFSTLPEMLYARLEQFDSDGVRGSIAYHPGLEDLQNGDLITISITDHQEDHLEGEYQELPVYLEFSGTEVPEELTVAVDEILPSGIRATMPSRQMGADQDSPPVLKARISGDHPDGGISWADLDGQYRNWIVVPDIFNSGSQIAVSLTEPSGHFPEGTIVGWEKDGEWSQIKPSLKSLQQALFAMRRSSDAESARYWKEVFNTAEDELLRVDARRGMGYAQVEGALSEGDFQTAREKLEDLKSFLKGCSVSDDRRSVFRTELRSYEKLVKATEQAESSDNDGTTSLQRIAVNIGFLPLVKEAIGLLEEAQNKAQADSFEAIPNTPHPQIVQRIRRLATQFEREPDEVIRFLEQRTALDGVRWNLSPALRDDQLTGESLDEVFTTDVFETSDGPSSDGSPDTRDAEAGESGDDSKDLEEEGENPTAKQSEPDPTTATSESTSVDDDAPLKEEGPSASASTAPGQDTATESSDPTEEGASTNSSSSTTESPSRPESPTEADSGTLIDTESPPESTVSKSELRRLRARAESDASDDPSRNISTVTGSRYRRSSAIKDYAKARADGICEACNDPAPFETAEGEPYLEAHHVDELGNGGRDHPDKVAAICPTCHKRIHHGANGDQLNEALREKLESSLAQVGTDR